jgi:hypothetical protein
MQHKPEVKTRLLTSMVSAGQLGKTTVLGEGLVPWLKFIEVPYLLIDADSEHRTLSDRFPEAIFHQVNTIDAFGELINNSGKLPVEIVDFPAQSTSTYVEWISQRRWVDALEHRGVRFTIFIFAADLPAAIQSASQIVRAFSDRADYVVVENGARYRSKQFYQTAVAKELADFGAKKVDVPFIMDMTRAAVKSQSAKAGRWLTLDEAKMHVGEIERMDIEFFVNQMAMQCEDILTVLVPDPSSIKNKCIRVPFPTTNDLKGNPRLLGAL